MTTRVLHNQPHPLAGKTVKLRLDIQDSSGELQAGLEYRLEDWWDRISGGSWMHATGNPACMKYAMRTGLAGNVPIDNKVVYGKVGGFGHLIHVNEIEGITP